jgi:NodT family efflux transporter outer membrane factor (OMF) lipoprotein
VAPASILPTTYIENRSLSKIEAESLQPSANWWQNLGDPVLNELIAQALKAAPTLVEAEARVRQARALRSAASAEDYPTVNADGQYARQLGSNNVPIGVPPGGLGPGIRSNLWQAGFDASWELDIFGGVRRSIEAADAQTDSSIASRDDAVLSLEAEIARNYVEVRAAQRKLSVAHENLAIANDLQALTASLFQAGLTSELNVLRAQAQVSAIAAGIPPLLSRERTSAYRIAALMGGDFYHVTNDLLSPGPIPYPVSDVPIGLPSDLLKRRPDVRAAERRVAAESARIGAVESDLYPHFSLTGVVGIESLNLSSFLNTSSGYYQIGPNLSWRIFDARKIRFEVAAQRAQTEASTAAYQQVVLNAFRDVEAALVTHANDDVRLRQLADQIAVDRKSTELSRLLFAEGLESFLPVLDAERTLYLADNELADSERDSHFTRLSAEDGRPPGRPTPDQVLNETTSDPSLELRSNGRAHTSLQYAVAD